jgi:ATP-dependent Clp protease ATP-binding subunit ClpC
MFDRFTDRAKRLMSLSRQEAVRLQHPFIAPEHLMLAMILEGTGIGLHVLRDRYVDLETIRKTLEELVPRGLSPVTVSPLPFTPETRGVLELAMEEASQMAHDHVSTEHLLLGLAGLQEGNVARLLREHGLGLFELREDVLDFLGDPDDAARGGEADAPG